MTYVNEHVNEDDMEFCIMHWFDNSEAFRILDWFDSAKDYVGSIEHVNMGDMELCRIVWSRLKAGNCHSGHA